MVCSKADTHLEAKLSFGCDKEPFGLCGTINIVLYNRNVLNHFFAFVIITRLKTKGAHVNHKKAK